jgi:hypothetical protein
MKIATNEMDKAINDLKTAVKLAGANPYQTPPPQNAGDVNGNIHQALQLLHDARSNIEHEADPPGYPGLQANSLRHIEAARHELQQIVDNVQ